MKSRKRMTQEVREKINNAIKNKSDIADLIEDYFLANEYLAGAIISRFNRINENIDNANFVRCTFGKEGEVINFSGCSLKGSNFSNARFLGTAWFRGCDLRNANFNSVWLPNVEYQHADLRNITICDAVFKFGSKCGMGAKFDGSMFKQLINYLSIEKPKKIEEIE